ncbi:polyubiquitin 12-like [Cornus florida]|uniref:polyubiquitin 12-like n=1 Tax=Cornus florida TaxID=4283 RepID=UPI00289D31C5|nr:polyubiquitin 12-like [Cornus florida]
MPPGEIMKPEVKVMHTVRKQLEDSKTMAFYNITEECILEMFPPPFQIFVKQWSGGTVTLIVRLQNTVKDVKKKIFVKLGLPVDVQGLVFAGIGDLKTLVREKVKKPVKEAFLRGKKLREQLYLILFSSSFLNAISELSSTDTVNIYMMPVAT